jgi:DNA-binding MarR family transcriptional regulator
MKEQFAGPHVDVEKAIAFWLLRASAGVRSELYRAFRVLGLEMTPEQWEILGRLWAVDQLSQRELCALTRKDKPTISRILDVMEARGWVRRTPAPDDARSHLIALTPAGRRLEAKALPVAKQVVGKLEGDLTEKELRTLRGLLQRVAANLEGAGAE